MARYLRVEYPGAIYHVTVGMLGEGVQSRRLFRDERDHLHFLKRLGERVETYGSSGWTWPCYGNGGLAQC